MAFEDKRYGFLCLDFYALARHRIHELGFFRHLHFLFYGDKNVHNYINKIIIVLFLGRYSATLACVFCKDGRTCCLV